MVLVSLSQLSRQVKKKKKKTHTFYLTVSYNAKKNATGYLLEYTDAGNMISNSLNAHIETGKEKRSPSISLPTFSSKRSFQLTDAN